MLPLLYHAHHIHHQEDLPFWQGLVAQSGDPLLELGCGTGRVLIPLLQAGQHALGLERDRAMLRILQERAGKLEGVQPQLIQADMCRFHLAMRFPLIILPCNTLSTLSEIERLACLGCVHQHLQPNGLFVFSIPNPQLLRSLPARSEAQLEDEFILPETGNPLQVSSSWHKTKRSLTITWTYDQLLPDGRVERSILETVHQLATVEKYLDEISSTGMRVMGLVGDYDRSEYRQDSPSLIVFSSIC
jgi:SAM-dependent methyltransferase